MVSREIGLLRHFPTDWNSAGRLQGRSDIPLSEASLAELATRRLPPRWRGLPMLVSPLIRARQTADALAEGASIAIDERLTEMDFGEWEGRIGADLLADPACAYRPVEEWGEDFRPPSGESPAEMFARLTPVLAEAAAQAPCLIVAHRGVMRCILAAAAGWRYRGPEPFRIKRAAVHPITLSAPGARENFAPTGFLAPEKLEFR